MIAMRTFKLFFILLCMVSISHAELRTWTLTNGQTLKAELSRQDRPGGDNVKLVDADGENISVPLDKLSPADQEYVDIARVPAIDVDLLRELRQVHFSSKVAAQTSDVREPEIRAQFGVRVKQTGFGTYKHELKAEIFAIGRQIYADCYMVLARESVSFRLSKENDKRFEYMSDRWAPLRDLYLGVGQFARRGEKYHGYLILVTDELGRLVAHEESPDWLFDYRENMMKLKPGNYFDNHCIRRSPVRPDPIVDLSF